MLIIELNSFAKSTDVQSGPGMATIFSRAGGSGVGIDEACGQEEKKMKGYCKIGDLRQHS